MYTGLNCTAFSILRKRLEPILTSYGSNPEKIHQLCILNFVVVDDNQVNTQKPFAVRSGSMF